jgi:hypothetical protein
MLTSTSNFYLGFLNSVLNPNESKKLDNQIKNIG